MRVLAFRKRLKLRSYLSIYIISWKTEKKKRQSHRNSGLSICRISVGASLLSYLTPKSANWRIALFLPVKCTA